MSRIGGAQKIVSGSPMSLKVGPRVLSGSVHLLLVLSTLPLLLLFCAQRKADREAGSFPADPMERRAKPSIHRIVIGFKTEIKYQCPGKAHHVSAVEYPIPISTLCVLVSAVYQKRRHIVSLGIAIKIINSRGKGKKKKAICGPMLGW